VNFDQFFAKNRNEKSVHKCEARVVQIHLVGPFGSLCKNCSFFKQNVIISKLHWISIFKDEQACLSLTFLFQIKMKKATEFGRDLIQFMKKQIDEEVIISA
jgi:hypothetical protein